MIAMVASPVTIKATCQQHSSVHDQSSICAIIAEASSTAHHAYTAAAGGGGWPAALLL